MKNLDLLYLNSRSIQRCQPKHKQNHLKKLRNKQSNELNKYIILDKTWKLLPLRQNLAPLNIPISKISSKPKFFSEIGLVLYLQGLKKFIGPWRSINSKIFKTKNINWNFNEMLLKIGTIPSLESVLEKWF